jgi:hypothetical protein
LPDRITDVDVAIADRLCPLPMGLPLPIADCPIADLKKPVSKKEAGRS